jgi:hypothetical protein
VLGIIR